MTSRQLSYSYVGIAILIPLIFLGTCARVGSPPIDPTATVSISPATFCPGEILTATWDGGDQPADCLLSAPDDETCKSFEVRGSYGFLSVPQDYSLYNQRGSASGATAQDTPYDVTYSVYWTLWGVLDVSASSKNITSENIGLRGDQGWHCDEETNTIVLSAEGGSNPGLRVGGGDERMDIYDGPPSQCIASTRVCLAPIAFDAEGTPTSRLNRSYLLTVPGGPSVVLTSDEPCTDEFMGYHPYDIHISSPDDSAVSFGASRPDHTGEACNPDIPNDGYTEALLEYYIAPGDLCGIGPAEGLVSGQGTINDPASFVYGSVPLLGISRDRCLNALDPSFAAALVDYRDNLLVVIPETNVSIPGIGPGSGEDQKEDDKSDGSPFCGSVCSSDADCAGLGVNPACVSGACYDGQTCDSKPPSSSGGSNDDDKDSGPSCETVCTPNCPNGECGGVTCVEECN